MNNKFFNSAVINKGRQIELDSARAFVLFLLPFIHATIEFTPEENLTSGIPYLFDTVIGGPMAAPMFIFLMGLNMIYAHNNRAYDFFRRGVKFLFVGYALNFCRYLLPYIAGYYLTGNYEKYIANLIYYVMENDIMQFAAVAMFMMALMKVLRVPDALLLAIGLMMSLAGMCFNGVDFHNTAANILAGYFIGTEDAAGNIMNDFPLLNWFIVVAAGYVFGKILRHVKDKDRFYAIFSPACLLFTAMYFYVGITHELGMFGEGENCYYHITTQDVIACIIGVLGALGFWHLITKFLPQKFLTVINDISVNVNSIYCIHWVILSCVTVSAYAAFGLEYLDVMPVMIISLVISLTTITIAHYWRNR